MTEKQPSFGRGLVTTIGGVVILAGVIWGLLGLGALEQNLCEASHPGRTAECEGPLVWLAVRSFVSAGFGACAVLVAAKAKTVTMVWKGGIVLLLAGVFTSPIVVP
jgi:hypothetical protein